MANGLSSGQRQAIIGTRAGILLIGTLGTNFNEILSRIQTFSGKKMYLKMSSGKWRPFCLSLNVLKQCLSSRWHHEGAGGWPGKHWGRGTVCKDHPISGHHIPEVPEQPEDHPGKPALQQTVRSTMFWIKIWIWSRRGSGKFCFTTNGMIKNVLNLDLNLKQ